MNILVTGSNGFIGSWIVKELRMAHTVIGCGRKEEPSSEVDDYVKWNIGYENVPAKLLAMEIGAVVHIAASKSTDDDDLELSFINLVGTHQIINFCKAKKCNTAILISSIPIVGKPDKDMIREENPFHPPTMYHATKAAQELMFSQLSKSGIRDISLRIPSPIAPVMQGKTIFTIFADRAFRNEDIVVNGRGSRKQNYIDVRDIAWTIKKMLISPEVQGVYNIGSQNPISNTELAQMCIKIAGSKSKILYSGENDPADGQVWKIDVSKLQRDTGFKQRFSIEQTIREYIENLQGL